MDDYLVVYKIGKSNDFVKNNYDFIYPLVNKENNDLIKKFNKGINILGNPKDECIPVYNKTFFVFYNYKAIKRFLYSLCDFSKEELSRITEETGFHLYELHIDSISNGFSKMRGTVFPDEVLEVINIDFTDIK